MSCAFRAFTASPREWPALGSWLDESPIQTTTRALAGRYEMAPDATCHRPLMPSSGASEPPPDSGVRLFSPVCVADVLAVRFCSTWNAGKPGSSSVSLYSATANSAVGCADWMLLRMGTRFACTLAMTGPMLVVVSTRKTMSGFGGIGGVDTVLAIVVDPPGGRLRFTVDGETPGAANALPVMAIDVATRATAHRTAWVRRVMFIGDGLPSARRIPGANSFFVMPSACLPPRARDQHS